MSLVNVGFSQEWSLLIILIFLWLIGYLSSFIFGFDSPSNIKPAFCGMIESFLNPVFEGSLYEKFLTF